MPLVFGRSILGFAVVADTGVTWTDPDLTNASYDSVSFSFATQDTLPQDVTFKSDGTKMYIVGNANNTIFQYGLSTAWDISTASYESKSFNTTTQESGPADVFFKPDGSKFYVCGFSGSVYQYSMSTAWDVSTASYDSVSFSTSTQESSPRGVVFKSDGTKMFVTGVNSDAINEYSLSTAWDISTASYSQNFSISSQETIPQGLFFNPDGDRVWVIGDNETVYQYSLTTGWDVSTASYDSVSFSVSSQMTGAVGVEFKSDGSKMYVIDLAGDNVYQYSTVASAWTNPDLSSASYDSVSFSVASQDTVPNGIFFKPDGTKMYIAGNAGNDINEYNLSTAWVASSASYNQNFDVSAKETTPTGLYFKDDGTKMYVLGASSDSVHEYSLSTAWDISTGSFSQSYSVGTPTNPADLSFSADGTKMFVSMFSAQEIRQHNLTTAWDISTASYASANDLDVSTEETSPYAIFMAPTGTKLYVAGGATDSVHEYTLSTANDLSTASYASTSFNFSSQEDLVRGIYFKNDGSKMYIVGSSSDTVYQYST